MALLSVVVLQNQQSEAELLIRQLRRAGFDLNWYQTETESDFLAQLHKGLDLILADYSLPEFDALRALHHLEQQNLDIPFIIVVSGSISEEAAVECMKQGASDFLMKDSLERLGPAVSQALGRKKLRDERRRMESALSESEERYRQLVELSPDAIVVFDRKQVLYVSPSAGQELLGIASPFELVGKDLLDYIHPDARQATVAALQALELKTNGVGQSRAEFTTTLADGRELEIRVSSMPITYQGKPAQIAIVRDVSKRKQMETALRENEEHLRIALRTVDIAVFNQDRDLRYTWMYQPQLGFEVDAVVGRTDSELLPPEAAAQIMPVKRQVLKTNTGASGNQRDSGRSDLFL